MLSFDPKNIFWKKVDGEVVLLNAQKGACYTLSEVGSVIWSLIAEHKTEEEIVEHIVAHYQVEEDVARADLAEFVKHLIDSEVLAA